MRIKTIVRGWHRGFSVRIAVLMVGIVFSGLWANAVSGSVRAAGFSSKPDVTIGVTQIDGAVIRVTYDLRRAKRELIFGELRRGYRARRWTIESPGFELLRLADEDRIIRKDGKKFQQVTLRAAPDLIRLPKEYQPIDYYGKDGAMVYTGHFWPLTKRGGRLNATFDFTPTNKSNVVAFGARARILLNWRSPMAHPAFVYLGPLKPIETPDVMALVDDATPDWIVREFDDLTPRAFAHLAKIFGFSPKTKPNLFLSAPLGTDDSRLSYAGDALPGQFQITLEGAAWRLPTDQARKIFRRATVHEAVHLWQSSVRPNVEDIAGWIHEGAADAIAAETLLALGLWDGAQFDQDLHRAKKDCARSLDHVALKDAQEVGRFRALYVCGHVIAHAVASADGTSVSAFWRDFVEEAKGRDGYSEALFFDFVEYRTGRKDFAELIKRFVRTPLANPKREIARLLDAAALKTP